MEEPEVHTKVEVSVVQFVQLVSDDNDGHGIVSVVVSVLVKVEEPEVHTKVEVSVVQFVQLVSDDNDGHGIVSVVVSVLV